MRTTLVRILLFSTSENKAIWAVSFKNELTNHQLLLSESQCMGKSQNRASLQAGMVVVGGSPAHGVGPNLHEGNERYLWLPDCHSVCDSSSQATNSTGCRQVPCTCRGRGAVSWELRTQMSETEDELKTATGQSSRPRAQKQAWETPYVSWSQVSSGTCKQGLFYTVCLLTVVRKSATGQQLLDKIRASQDVVPRRV